MKTLLIACGVALLVGCATPTVYMNPKTGIVQQCDTNSRPLVRQAEINKCSEAFERMGWQKQ
jgi:hypothetical protein